MGQFRSNADIRLGQRTILKVQRVLREDRQEDSWYQNIAQSTQKVYVWTATLNCKTTKYPRNILDS